MKIISLEKYQDKENSEQFKIILQNKTPILRIQIFKICLIYDA